MSIGMFGVQCPCANELPEGGVAVNLDQPPVEAVATWPRLVDDAYVSRFRLETPAQAIDIRLRRADLAGQFDFARAGRIGHRDRVLVNAQADVQRAIVFHAGLRGGNRRVWRRPHRAALAETLTRV